MKILFITPHLSTGGAPQYLLKKIKELVSEHDIFCIEYDNITGGILVVQRTQISDILGNRLITLNNNKHEIINHIKKIKPDVIHFEELPEYFFDNNLAKQIYSSNRKYKIFETSHDSSFNPNNKCFFPDAFIFVSPYQKQLFKSLNIESHIVEYPIETKIRSEREKALKELNLDPNKTHFLNVGLFTSRKNQSEIIEYARHLLKKNVQFHFVGNQADNFKWYWEPLMQNFPRNCKWWGERKDVDKFYNAMDVFLFTSRGTNNDKETNPLVIKEAIGWKLPILMYNLPVYCGMYDKHKNITWLKNNFDENLNIISSFILDKSDKKEELFDISFNETNNKFDVFYNGKEVLNDILFSIKDIDSKTCIYSCKWNTVHSNTSLWAVPIPKNHYDFQNNPEFGGFLLQIFSKNEKIYETQLIIKKINTAKPIIEFSDEDPIFRNYNEFFIEKIYDEFNLKNLNTCIDIGANVGLFTKYLKMNNCKSVYCYEPNKIAFKSLQKNLNNEKNIKFFNLAVGIDNKPLRLYIDSTNTLVSSACNKTDNFYDVDVVKLDQILTENNLSKIDLLKIDIEGMEFELIDKCDELIFSKVKRFLIEYHDFYFEDGINKVQKLKEKLESYGYTTISKQRFIFATK